MIDFKAIQTKYKGYKFRSRTEARWGVYFDALGITWEYEKEGFSLPSGAYLPDFWLPQVAMWAEVKGKTFTRDELQLCIELVSVTQHPVLLLDGAPDFRTYFAIEHPEYNHGMWDIPVVEHDIPVHRYWETERRFFEDSRDSIEAGCEDRAIWPENWSFQTNPTFIGEAAVKAARSARFEHGETPT